MLGKTVLIIDDEPRLQTVLQMTLEIMGQWSVLLATNGEIGITIALEQQPDAILLDMMLPDMNGLETLAKLRDSSFGQEIPVIILSAKDRPVSDEQIDSYKISGVLEKPFDPLLLSDQIYNLLGWSSLGAVDSSVN
ncbi:MAG: response regulator [Cyanobacteria bacterium P01_H01_bin.15]